MEAMVFSGREIIDIITVSIITGFIFAQYFQRPRTDLSGDIESLMQSSNSLFNWTDIKYAMMIIAPSIVLHEFGHKFVAMGFGLEATFHIPYLWLGLGVLLRVLRSSFIFLVPAYVEVIGGNAITGLVSAFAGPLVNGLLWLGSKYWIKYKKPSGNELHFVAAFMQLNGLLAVFNMIPLPGFDGYHVFSNLISIAESVF